LAGLNSRRCAGCAPPFERGAPSGRGSGNAENTQVHPPAHSQDELPCFHNFPPMGARTTRDSTAHTQILPPTLQIGCRNPLPICASQRIEGSLKAREEYRARNRIHAGHGCNWCLQAIHAERGRNSLQIIHVGCLDAIGASRRRARNLLSLSRLARNLLFLSRPHAGHGCDRRPGGRMLMYNWAFEQEGALLISASARRGNNLIAVFWDWAAGNIQEAKLARSLPCFGSVPEQKGSGSEISLLGFQPSSSDRRRLGH